MISSLPQNADELTNRHVVRNEKLGLVQHRQLLFVAVSFDDHLLLESGVGGGGGGCKKQPEANEGEFSDSIQRDLLFAVPVSCGETFDESLPRPFVALLDKGR